MPVKKGDDGQRSVEAEVEVPGTPEEVWRAIATGKGISSWFVPSTVEEKAGGKAVSSFGPGMDSVATIKTWNPPRSLTFETEEGGPGPVATEWTVEARTGGTCVVRVVHRWFARTDDWDAEFEGHAFGWLSFFRLLRMYLTHFPGQPCSDLALSAFSQATPAETWHTVMSALEIDEARRVSSTSGAPEIAGAVESAPEAHPELILRLDRPAPGFVHMFVMPMGGPTLVSMRFYLFGARGAAAVVKARSDWESWLGERFPQEVSR